MNMDRYQVQLSQKYCEKKQHCKKQESVCFNFW